MNTKIIKLDINNKMYETITAKQGDTESRFLLFHLFDASLPFDLTEKSVRVYGIKPDGTKIFNDLVINDVKKGYCTLKLTNQMLAIAGLVKLELVIYSGNKKLSSIPFMLNVISSLNSDDAVVSTNEFTSLMNGLAALSEYDIYKSNAKQVPGIKEEVSNLSSQLGNKTNNLQGQINNLVLVAQAAEEVVYNNLFYNSSYTSKSVTTTYAYQAFGTPVAFDIGKYLVYFNFNVTGTINASINVGMTADSGTYIGLIDECSKRITETTSNVIVYGVVDLPKSLSIRPILNIKNLDSSTPDVTITINNLFVTQLDNANEKLINELNNIKTNVENVKIKVRPSDLEIVQARGKYELLNDRLNAMENSISENKEIANSITVNKIIDCWGDSLTYGVASSTTRGGYVTRLKNKLGENWSINNFGVGGEKTKTIACRQGGMNFVVQPGVTIPSTVTPIEINLLSDDGSPVQCRDTNLGCINPCFINGIEGTLTIDYGTYTKHFFTRKVIGDEYVITRPTTLITANKNRKGNINIIWIGQNGEKHTDHSGWDSEDDLVNQIRKMVEIANNDRYLILGLHTKDLTSRKLLEEKMYNEFGRHYINLRKYLSTPIYDTNGTSITSSYGLDDVGFSATDNDKRFIGMGYCPPSLLTDGVHGKDEFFDIITKLVYDRGNELGYW
ncbi:BppU family phage baseplate upper protein [uncultured Clostridium sp.]|jgi:hypothetical protein|uniref:BppU family phage baseplate upper protein n=1 Tax=uncultured Clostridium sp. TaxID=59620 RepID=UPI00205044F2|nr:BppU family phage baseplate upper protein [uncultured Clostridium sp.]DAU87222.1 MAG TPA: Baseplate component [Caudoviricetes sp.]